MLVLASYPKSGSTWLRMLLSAFKSNGKVDINDMYYKYGDPCYKYLQMLSPVPLENLTREQFWYLRYGAVQLFQMREHAGVQVYKTHGARCHYHGSPWMPDDWVQGVIYMVRDPRDVCVSYAKHVGMSHEQVVEVLRSETAWTANQATPNVGQPMGNWSLHIQSWLTDELKVPKLLIRYEDLKTDPTGALVQTLRFMGCPEEEITHDRVKSSVEACHIKRLQRQEDTKGFVEGSKKNKDRFFWRGKVGGWKEDLAPELAEAISLDHTEMMKQLRYLEEKNVGSPDTN